MDTYCNISTKGTAHTVCLIGFPGQNNEVFYSVSAAGWSQGSHFTRVVWWEWVWASEAYRNTGCYAAERHGLSSNVLSNPKLCTLNNLLDKNQTRIMTVILSLPTIWGFRVEGLGRTLGLSYGCVYETMRSPGLVVDQPLQINTELPKDETWSSAASEDKAWERWCVISVGQIWPILAPDPVLFDHRPGSGRDLSLKCPRGDCFQRSLWTLE